MPWSSRILQHWKPVRSKKPVLVLRSRLKKNLFLLWTKEKKVNSLWSLIVKTPDIRLPPLSWYWWWLFRDIYIHNIHTGGYLIMIISLTINKKILFLKYILINFYEYLNLWICLWYYQYSSYVFECINIMNL